MAIKGSPANSNSQTARQSEATLFRNARPTNPPGAPWYYNPIPLTAKEAVSFVVLITDAFPVEERDIISHWFSILTD